MLYTTSQNLLKNQLWIEKAYHENYAEGMDYNGGLECDAYGMASRPSTVIMFLLFERDFQARLPLVA